MNAKYLCSEISRTILARDERFDKFDFVLNSGGGGEAVGIIL